MPPVVSRFVEYYTIGWNKDGTLVHVPVVTSLIAKENSQGLKYSTENFDLSAKREGCTLFLADPADFGGLDKFGTKFICHGLMVVDYRVRADTVEMCRIVIDSIKTKSNTT